jgi:hypothetical protein
MSKPHPTTDAITPGQAELLDLMRDALGPLSRRELLAGAHMSRTMMGRHLLELQGAGLLDVTLAVHQADAPGDKRGNKAYLYSITRTGSRALARHKRQFEEAGRDVVPPPTFNTAGTTFEPTHRSYYRNAGNKHIASAGVGC